MSMDLTFFIGISASFITTYMCILLLKPVAYKIGLVDEPGGRKHHAHITPLIGGIAMLLGLFVGLILLSISLKDYRGFVLGSAILVFIGVLDDFHELSARGRLIAQLLALSIMIFWSGVQLENLGNLIGQGDIHLGWIAIPLTLFGAASLVNAVNMLDGLDGLAGSVVAIALVSLMMFAIALHAHTPALLLAVMITAILAYLCFNFPFPGRKHAWCFMGDAGSMLLGFTLAWFTIALSQQPGTLAPPAIMLWVAAIPLLDLATVFIKRIMTKRSPLAPGRDHIHHTLQNWGLSRRQTLWTIIGLMLAANITAWLFVYFKVAQVWVFGSFVGVFVVYFMLLVCPWKSVQAQD